MMGFIYVGRLDELKGIKLLFKAWKLMGADASELKVCGTGPLEDWCKEYITENNMRTVSMLGHVSNAEAKKLIAESKALILPTQWYEGFPMTILEAYSVGTPVITSDLGNTGAVVINGVTGYKFKADSVEELKDVVKKIEVTEEIDWESNVLNEYKNRYSPERNYEMLSSVYMKAKKHSSPATVCGGGYRLLIAFQACLNYMPTESVAA